ncbi:MAG: GNAT family N-acetyltransferase [Saprospiraceae bacterium]|nr:GNAT family N-acetyltransferase [Saprospiraceae bacterium]
MNIIEVDFATPEYDDTVRLRHKILRAPLNLDFSAEEMAKEFTDIHLAAYDLAWILRGCLVLTLKTDKVLKMRQVAVDLDAQKQGIGQAMVRKSEAIAKVRGFERMELNARDTAVPFYEKLGYHTEGGMFEEVSIPHFKMAKDL